MTLQQLLEVACSKKQLSPAEYCLKLEPSSFMIDLSQTLETVVNALLILGKPTIQLHLVKMSPIELERHF